MGFPMQPRRAGASISPVPDQFSPVLHDVFLGCRVFTQHATPDCGLHLARLALYLSATATRLRMKNMPPP
jgi:hypothetical protein